MSFTLELLDAIGAWQRGWREQQERRLELAVQLEAACAGLAPEFRTVNVACYRKRFLHKGELVRIFLEDHSDEGVVSWTTDIRFAERFKGFYRADAVSGAIFRHTPPAPEVIVNIFALWGDAAFIEAARTYRDAGGANADALWNFGASQSEVVLRSPLQGSEIIGLTGASSPFDEICDSIGLPENQRDETFQRLIEQGMYPGEYRLLPEENTRGIIDRTIRQMIERIEAARARSSN